MKYLLFSLLFVTSLLSSTLQKVSLQLSWFDQFQFAGYYIAKEKGFYNDVGLDVTIKPFDFGINVLKAIADEKADFGIGRETLVLEGADKDLIFLSAIFQSSPLALLTTQDSKINSIKDFKNKKLMATIHDANEISIKAMIQSQGVSLNDIAFIKHSHNINDLIQKKTDIISAYISKSPFELEQKGIKYNIFHPKDFGFDLYSDFLFTSKKFTNKNPAAAEKFRQASLKGWKYAYDHIEEAVDLIQKKYNTQNLSKEALVFEAKRLKKLSFYKTDTIGNIDKAKFQRIYDLYNIMGYVKKPINLDSLMYEGSYHIYLTQEERKWIKKNPVIKFSFLEYPPLSINEEGISKGMLQDTLDIVSKETGLIFNFTPSKSLKELQIKFINKQIDFIPSLNFDFENRLNGVKTYTYEEYPMVIVSKDQDNYEFIKNLSTLSGKSIAVPKNFYADSYLKENYPFISLKYTQNIKNAFSFVENDQADAFVGHIASALYYLSLKKSKELKISGVTDSDYEHRLLIQKNSPELLSIINKVLSSIPHAKKNKIYQKWKSVKKEKKNNNIFIIFAFGAFIIAVVFLFKKYKNLEEYTKNVEVNANRLSLSIEGNKEGIFDWNVIDDTTYFSPRWKEIIGYKDHEIENNFESWKTRVHPDDLNTIMNIVNEHFNGIRDDFDNLHRIKHKNGTWLWIYARGKCKRDKEGNVIRITGTHLDITDNKNLQLKLQQQNQIIQEVHDSIITTDVNGFITSWNHGSFKLFGYEESEVLGVYIGILSPDEYRNSVESNISRLLKIQHFNTEVPLKKKSSEHIYVELSLSVLKNTKGDIVGLIGYSKDITDRKKAEKELLKQKEIFDYQAHHDSLTELPNRLLLFEKLDWITKKTKRNKSSFALFFLDIDNFKHVNDSLGHQTGDTVLKTTSQRLKETLREEDTIARISGDEFIIVIENLDNEEDASSLIEKIIENISKPITTETSSLNITVSIGVVFYPNDASDSSTLIKYADNAMYKTKRNGKNNFCFYHHS